MSTAAATWSARPDELERSLDPARFARVHRSYIVAIRAVASVRRRDRVREDRIAEKWGGPVARDRRRIRELARIDAVAGARVGAPRWTIPDTERTATTSAIVLRARLVNVRAEHRQQEGPHMIVVHTRRKSTVTKPQRGARSRAGRHARRSSGGRRAPSTVVRQRTVVQQRTTRAVRGASDVDSSGHRMAAPCLDDGTAGGGGWTCASLSCYDRRSVLGTERPDVTSHSFQTSCPINTGTIRLSGNIGRQRSDRPWTPEIVRPSLYTPGGVTGLATHRDGASAVAFLGDPMPLQLNPWTVLRECGRRRSSDSARRAALCLSGVCTHRPRPW
jgi:hypothetical protein